jgi:hypothetical protein
MQLECNNKNLQSIVKICRRKKKEKISRASLKEETKFLEHHQKMQLEEEAKFLEYFLKILLKDVIGRRDNFFEAWAKYTTGRRQNESLGLKNFQSIVKRCVEH